MPRRREPHQGQAARRCRGALRGGAPHRARERERERERERDGAAVKRRSDQYDRAAFVEVSAETWASQTMSQTRQFLASRTRRELLGSGVLGLRGRARSCALFGTRPTHPVCVLCVEGPARARRVCSTLHPYIILPFSSSTRAARARLSLSVSLSGLCALAATVGYTSGNDETHTVHRSDIGTRSAGDTVPLRRAAHLNHHGTR